MKVIKKHPRILSLKIKKGISIVLFLGFAIAIWAQNTDPVRLEIPAKNGSNPFNYITAGIDGICVFYPTINETGRDSISWSFMMTDTQLKPNWAKLISMHEDVTFLKGFSKNRIIYLLFHDTKRNKEGNIFVFMINPSLQLITEHRSQIPDKAEVIDFDIYKDYALIGYNLRKAQPVLFGFSLVTAEKRNFDVTSEKDALLLDVAISQENSEIYTVYKVQYSNSRNRVMLNIYNEYGGVKKQINFESQKEKCLINSAQYIPYKNGLGLIAGTYGYYNSTSKRPYNYYDNYYNYYYRYSPYYYYNRQQDYDANTDNTPVSDGFFSASIKNSTGDSIRYFSFSTFNNAFKYMTDANALKVKMRNERKQGAAKSSELDEGKENSLELRLITHDIKQYNDGFILAAEAYSPEYQTVTRMSYDYYGRSFPSTYQVFEGFRYSHAFITSFDSLGNMKWNNGIEMKDILTKFLNRKLNYLIDNQEMVLYYNANNKVAFKTIKGSEIIENTTYTQISPKLRTDQPTEEYLGGIEYWYDDFFIASGYQSIKNNYIENSKRNVFYISKLAFR